MIGTCSRSSTGACATSCAPMCPCAPTTSTSSSPRRTRTGAPGSAGRRSTCSCSTSAAAPRGRVTGRTVRQRTTSGLRERVPPAPMIRSLPAHRVDRRGGRRAPVLGDVLRLLAVSGEVRRHYLLGDLAELGTRSSSGSVATTGCATSDLWCAARRRPAGQPRADRDDARRGRRSSGRCRLPPTELEASVEDIRATTPGVEAAQGAGGGYGHQPGTRGSVVRDADGTRAMRVDLLTPVVELAPRAARRRSPSRCATTATSSSRSSAPCPGLDQRGTRSARSPSTCSPATSARFA